jgi:hypothetical protein
MRLGCYTLRRATGIRNMARFVRFIVHQRIKGKPRYSGPFTAAYCLRETDELLEFNRERIDRSLAWFEVELTIPPRGTVPPTAIFWYADVSPFSAQMWELVEILREHDFSAELITARFIGKVVYRDKYQLAAVPRRGRKGLKRSR